MSEVKACYGCGRDFGPKSPLQQKAIIQMSWCTDCMAARDPNGFMGTAVKLARSQPYQAMWTLDEVCTPEFGEGA